MAQGSELFPSSLLTQVSLERPFGTRSLFKESHLGYPLASGPSLGYHYGAQFFPFHDEVSKHEKQGLSYYAICWIFLSHPRCLGVT